MADMTRKEVVEFLKTRDKSKPAMYRCNYLGDLNLRGLDLSGLDLSNLDVQYTDFSEANLSGVNFNGSFFCFTKLYGANLNGATFINAQMTSAKFGASAMVGTNFSGIHFGDGPASLQLLFVDLTGAKFNNAHAELNLLCANLTDVSFDNAIIKGSTFIGCVHRYTSYRNVDLREIALVTSVTSDMLRCPLSDFMEQRAVPEWCKTDNSTRPKVITVMEEIDFHGARKSSKTLQPHSVG